MPGQEHEQGAERPSRRAVLRGAAGAGAAGVAATALSGLSAAQAAETAQDSRAGGTEEAEHLVVHVRDARTGQIDVYRGTDQVRLHDRDLARHLDKISRR
jgi:hypothetical protein